MDENNKRSEEAIVENVEISEVIVEDSVDTTLQSSDSDAIVVMNLQNLINETLNRINTISEEVKPLDEMISNVLENDQVYKKHMDDAKEAAKIRNATKSEIMKRPDVSNIANKVKEKKADMKEAKESLSEYLQEYARLTGQRQFETPEGTVQEIVYSAKLVKRS